LIRAILNRNTLHRRLVDYHVRLARAEQLSHHDRLEALIGLKQTLRDLCVVAGAWDPELEQAHEADLTALRKLAHPAPDAESFQSVAA
jgi:hypothetical protein